MLTIIRGLDKKEKLRKALELAQIKDSIEITIISDPERYKEIEEFEDFWVGIAIKEYKETESDENMYMFKELLKPSKEMKSVILYFSFIKYSRYFKDYAEIDSWVTNQIILNSENKNIDVYFILEEKELPEDWELYEEQGDSNSMLLKFAHKIIRVETPCQNCQTQTIFKTKENQPICLNCYSKTV